MAQSNGITERLARTRLLMRGESLIAFVGLSTAAILLAIVGAAGWWSMRGQEEAWRFVRTEQTRVLSDVLTHSAESMLAGEDLSALRRLLIEAKQQHDLTYCRIVLADGQVLADADPTKITLPGLPAHWPSGPVDAPAAGESGPDAANRITIARPLLIRGRGGASFQLGADIKSVAMRLWETGAGMGLIGAAGLAGMLIVYRQIRSRVATLGLIRESLLATQEDGASRDALTLRGNLGPEAAAWNNLLLENQSLRNASVAERVKGALENRREGRGDLEHACDALSVGMIVVDGNGSVKHANGAAAVLLQLKRDQMIGQQINQLVQDESLRNAINSVVSGAGQRKTMEIKRPEDQGGGIVRAHLRPVRREDAAGALITLEDVTQQRVADAARNSFVAQATHELRTPLTNMRLCLENALDDQNSDATALREHFNTLSHETRRLERMVGEMLSVAQIEAGSLSLHHDDVRMDKAFEELESDYKPQAAAKQITLMFDLPPKFPVIQGDRDKLMVTLHNLIGNAVKYTPNGGKVTVAVRSTATQFMVEVTDTGIGISPDEQQKLFQKFYRAKDPRVAKITGTGLGLALAREIARLHGGDIALTSELNQGSTFTLTLPVASNQAKAA